MLLLVRVFQRLGIADGVRPLVSVPPDDPLADFGPETPVHRNPDAVVAAVAWWVASFAVTALVAVVSSLLFGTLRDRFDRAAPRQAFVAPSASPIEVQYPDYPGAPLLQAAVASVSDRPTKHVPTPEPRVVEAEARQPFAVRRPAPQLVSTTQLSGGSTSEPNVQPLTDSPPRRIASAQTLAVTTLGGTATDGRLALVLEVTEGGDVARIVSHEAVNVDRDVIDSVSAAALTWRYEPARRDGVAIPATVRVVVELNGR